MTVGYAWNNGGGDGADPIVLTIPPGTFASVGLNGPSLSGTVLNRGDIVNGVPCGVIFQDAFQGLVVVPSAPSSSSSSAPTSSPTSAPSSSPTSAPSSSSFSSGTLILPSSVPVGKHCGTSSGSLAESYVLRHVSVIEGICRCRLGVVPTLLEVSGVYLFNNPLSGTLNVGDSVSSKLSELQLRFGWVEATTNRHPRIFACREDYSTYFLFLFTLWSSGRTTYPGVTSTTFSSLWTTLTGSPPTSAVWCVFFAFFLLSVCALLVCADIFFFCRCYYVFDVRFFFFVCACAFLWCVRVLSCGACAFLWCVCACAFLWCVCVLGMPSGAIILVAAPTTIRPTRGRFVGWATKAFFLWTRLRLC